MANELKLKYEQTAYGFHFWRTTDKAEVDFVIAIGNQILPIEVKFKEIKTSEISKSLHSFISKYKPRNVTVIHLGEEFTTNINEANVTFLPFYKLNT